MPLPVGLVYDAAGHVILDPDIAVRGAVAHLFTTFEATGSATACVKAFRAAGLLFPWRHLKGPRKGEIDWQPLAHHTVLRVLHNPRYAGCFTYGRHAHRKPPGGKQTTTQLPREEWISFIPGAHPGYITLDQYDPNLARLAANAAAHGRDRRSGPPREGPALLQGIIICGRCGLRMTVRYHHRRGQQEVPTYMCQRDGIENGARPARPSPARTWTRPSASCSSTPSPRSPSKPPCRSPPSSSTGPPRPTRCAPPTWNAPATSPTWPAAATWPSTPPTGSSPTPSKPTGTPPSARSAEAQEAYEKARKQHAGQLTAAQQDPDTAAGHRPARHLERPRHPAAGTQAHRPAAAHRRHRDQDQRH